PSVFDVTDYDAVVAAVNDGAPVDILVNNAGNAGRATTMGREDLQTLVETEPADWEGFIRVNMYGVMYATRAALPAMIEAGWWPAGGTPARNAHDVLAAIDGARAALAQHDYLADEGLAAAIFLAMRLQRPLLLEGEAGVGKTEVAKVLARWTGGELVRLQCYEGIDAAQAVYEWDYSRQLLHLRAAEASHAEVVEAELYSERFLVRLPLLRAIDYRSEVPPVLLVDEVDRADDEFEAFLLEILSDYTITVP